MAYIFNPTIAIKTGTNEGSGQNILDTTNSTATNLAFKSLTSTGATVTITNTSTTVNFEASGSGSSTTFAGLTDVNFTSLANLNLVQYSTGTNKWLNIAISANVNTLLGSSNYAAFKTSLSLNNVENTALSTWAGSTNITTLGTISTGSIPYSLITSGPTQYTDEMAEDAIAGAVISGTFTTWTYNDVANTLKVDLSATGTPSSSTFLRGDNSWVAAVPLAGGIMTGLLTLSGDPSTALQAVTKQYADAIASGIDFKQACFAATTSALNATYVNGVAGVGATLTNAGALIAFSVDGQSPAINSRILVKNQSSTFQNGVYFLSTVGSGGIAWVLTRALDYDQTTEIYPGTLIPVDNGTINALTSWVETSTVTTIGTDPIIFSQFTASPSNFFQVSNNLSEGTASTIRTNLGLGTLATQSGTFSGTSSGTNTGDQNIFQTISVSGQSDVIADTTTDILTLVAGSNVTITTNASTDTITISATGGGGSTIDYQLIALGVFSN